MKGLRRKSIVALFAALLIPMISCQGSDKKGASSQQSGVDKSAVGKPISGTPLKLGYLICNSKEETIERFAPIAAYIGRSLGRKILFHPMNTYAVEKSVDKYGIQFMKTNSIVYIQLKEERDVTLMAGEKRGPHGRLTSGTILSRKGSGIKKISDMKGKKYAFGPMFAPFGYLVQYDLMLKNGFDPEEDLAYYAIPWGAFKHEKAIYAVMFGGFEVGSGPMLDILSMVKSSRIKMEDFNIVAETELAPYCTFYRVKEANKSDADAIQNALLSMDKDSKVLIGKDVIEIVGIPWEDTGLVEGEVLNCLKHGKISGYETAKDTDYDNLRNMMRNVNMSPYDKY